MSGQMFLKYTDGCDLWHHCLTCPLPACQYDVPVSSHDKSKVKLHFQIEHYRKQGMHLTDIAHKLGISLRTVYRIRKLVANKPYLVTALEYNLVRDRVTT